VAFATCADFLRNVKQLLNMAPVIILSHITNPDFLNEIFESGARGVIPIADATFEQMIEIIGLVEVGGRFIPLSGLSSRRIKGRAVSARAVRTINLLEVSWLCSTG
jgi:DNA-binding NarL/FixJ family response regulator